MKKIISFLLILTVFVMLLAQSEAEVVIYDDAFEGQPTASGDLFSQDALTAAHEALPLGTKVELLHVTCNKRVVVTITDRIENASDLFWISKAAADSLNIQSVYPTEVLYTIVDESYSSAPRLSESNEILKDLGPNAEKGPEFSDEMIVRGNKESENPPHYAVQVFAALKRADAMELSRRLLEHIEYLSYVERARSEKHIVYRVLIGDFKTAEEAYACFDDLKYDFPESFIVEIY